MTTLDNDPLEPVRDDDDASFDSTQWGADSRWFACAALVVILMFAFGPLVGFLWGLKA